MHVSPLILILATLAAALVVFALLVWRRPAGTRKRAPPPAAARPPAPRSPAARPAVARAATPAQTSAAPQRRAPARAPAEFGDTVPFEPSPPRPPPDRAAPRPTQSPLPPPVAIATQPSAPAPRIHPAPVAARAAAPTPAAVAAPRVHAPAQTRPPPVPAARLAVLVADDSAVVRAKLKKSLEVQGWQVALAQDGLQALQALEARRFDLLITDLEMPRMDGRALIAAVQGSATIAALPILAITGHDQPQAELLGGARVRGVLRKPWRDSELSDALAALSGAERATSEPTLLQD